MNPKRRQEVYNYIGSKKRLGYYHLDGSYYVNIYVYIEKKDRRPGGCRGGLKLLEYDKSEERARAGGKNVGDRTRPGGRAEGEGVDFGGLLMIFPLLLFGCVLFRGRGYACRAEAGPTNWRGENRRGGEEPDQCFPACPYRTLPGHASQIPGPRH